MAAAGNVAGYLRSRTPRPNFSFLLPRLDLELSWLAADELIQK